MTLSPDRKPDGATRWILLLCAVLYGIVVLFLLVRTATGKPVKPFDNDAAAYSAGAKNISERGIFSFDGIHPTAEREPGYSFFLAPIYLLFGQENLPAIGLIQAGLHLLAVLLFVRALRPILPPLAPAIACAFLLLSPAIFKIVMTPYRESIALSLFLIFTTLFLSFSQRQTWMKTVGMGCMLACLLLTYAPLMLFTILLVPLFFIQRLPKRFLLPILLIPLTAVSLWMGRNLSTQGRFEFIGPYHTASLLHTRALQVRTFTLSDPLRCLWNEYITRNLKNQNPYCYVQFVTGGEDAMRSTMRDSEGILLRALPMAAWVTLFGVLEFHLPYVGGWGHFYNIAEACVTLLLSIGVLLSLRHIWKPHFAIFLLAMLYNIAISATLLGLPRFRMVTFFTYAVLAAVGYAQMLSRSS